MSGKVPDGGAGMGEEGVGRVGRFVGIVGRGAAYEFEGVKAWDGRL